MSEAEFNFMNSGAGIVLPFGALVEARDGTRGKYSGWEWGSKRVFKIARVEDDFGKTHRIPLFDIVSWRNPK